MCTNIKIFNNSSYITDSQLYDCLNLLPDKYKKLDTKVYIFNSYFSHFIFCLKNFKLLDGLIAISKLINSKIMKNYTFGYYSLYSKRIYIFEEYHKNELTYLLKNLLTKDNISIDINEYKRGWISFILIDILIHELTHAIQDKEKRLRKSILKNFFKSRGDSPWEIEAFKTTIEIMEKTSDKFLKILNTTGIHSEHSIEPIKVHYKCKITLKDI